ncbi:MAG: Spi family protease inhibitor, partial [Kiritimatiellae bacterium]|nr:Spi family protease inhibitor [Kiritimatiellia bacterium]
MRIKYCWGWLSALLVGAGTVQAERVTPQQAQTAALRWVQTAGERLGTTLPPAIDGITDYTNFYAVQLAPEGYVILSADTWIEPVIAFSGNGTFLPDENNPLSTLLQSDMPDRMALADYIEAHPFPPDADTELYEQAQRSADSWSILTSDTPPDDGTSSVSDVRIAPLVASQWSQSSAQGHNCYNYYTPSN